MKLISGIIFLFIIYTTGCTDERDPENRTPSANKLQYATEAEVQEMINERDGKILFVNVWATWCTPCVEEFPDLVKIFKEYRDKDFEFLSLSVDFGNNADSLVSSFIKAQNADFPVYIVTENSSQGVINLLGSEWSGAIPATFIFDREGVRQSFILGAHSFTYFKEIIDSILTN